MEESKVLYVTDEMLSNANDKQLVEHMETIAHYTAHMYQGFSEYSENKKRKLINCAVKFAYENIDRTVTDFYTHIKGNLKKSIISQMLKIY